jgi:membrane protein DedA with SNARE-associated domain
MPALFALLQTAPAPTDDLLTVYGLPAIFLVMLLKEAGAPIPIPGDLIMLGAVARAVAGQFDLVTVILTFEIAMILGGMAQYALARGPGRGFIYRFGRYIGLTGPRLDRAGAALTRGGAPALTVALVTPGVRAASVAAAGLARLPFGTFLIGLVIGNTVFFLLHVALGYLGAQGLASLLQATGLPAGPAILALVVALLVVGFVGWTLIRGRARRAGEPAPGLAEVVEAWEEACCPACLALGAIGQARAPTALPQP